MNYQNGSKTKYDIVNLKIVNYFNVGYLIFAFEVIFFSESGSVAELL